MRATPSRPLSAVEPDDIILSNRLARLRRRVRAVLLVRHVVVAMALAAVVGSIFLIWPAAIPAVAWVVAIVAAGASAVAVAWLRTPGVGEIAVLVDRRLQLADAVVMAAALRGSHDPIARLIVRDTLARMTDERIAGVFPFELRRPATFTVGAAVICLAVMSAVGRRVPSLVAGSSHSGAALGGGQSASSRGPSTTTGDAVVQRGPSELPADHVVPAAAPSATDTTPQEGDTARRRIDDPRPERPGDQATRADANRPGTSRDDRAARDGTQTGASPRAQTARAGGPATSASQDDETNGSGGIQRGDRRVAAPIARAPSAPDYRATYRTARTRADTAVARDDVPRLRRAYVRDYFLAIAPRD